MAQDKDWEKELRVAAERAGRELQAGIAYVNDRVVPEVRRQAVEAFATLSSGMRQLADLLERGAQSSRAPGDDPTKSAWARRW